jgi:hypothetical protein
MNNLPPKPLIFLVALAAVTQSYFYYEAIHVLRLQPHRYPYSMLIFGSALMMFLPLWGERRGVIGMSYILAIISCLAGIAMVVGIHHPGSH